MAFTIRGKAKVTIKKDTKQWDKMVRNLSRGNGSVVDVGWWVTRNAEGIPIAQIASWNEEGHVNGGMFAGTITPPRPFIRIGFIAKLKKTGWEKQYYPQIHAIAMGRSTWRKLHMQMGAELKNKLQQAILDWKVPANTPTTISMKGFNDPLINTGRMYDSVKFRVGRKRRV